MKKLFTSLCFMVCLTCALQLKAANANVNVADFAFTPQQVTINVGESVTWNWVNGTHPTQSDSNPAEWSTFTLGPGNTTFTHVFTSPGTYPYHCTIHGPSMSGTITVLAATGIKDEQIKHNVMVIGPNPAIGVLHVALNNKTAESYELKFTNAIGKTVKVISESELKADGELAVDIAELPAGLYFISLWNRDRIVETRKQLIVK